MRIKVSIPLFCLSALLGNQLIAAETALSSEQDKVSYSIGMDIGHSFRVQNLAITSKLFNQGFNDAVAGKKTLLSDEEAKAVLVSFQQKMLQEREQQNKISGAENLKKGQAFLDENKKRKEIVTLASGLQYRVIKQGTGANPTLADVVKTHYRGTLIDGTEFDSSYKRGEPATFPVQGVIPGWTEALQQMTPGTKWELFIPAGLAYGEQGAGKVIGPNETLVFEIELLDIVNQEEMSEG
jgi:FKBP-type peptidyl-prolyl cis-trans isomerase